MVELKNTKIRSLNGTILNTSLLFTQKVSFFPHNFHGIDRLLYFTFFDENHAKMVEVEKKRDPITNNNNNKKRLAVF